ncbi:MAG TPA: IPT/TIG domain-containing protein [Solirubrobacteraceae bacterium]|nr:IPT/TIG domain-containing protein [Solirubrobacteraceae bacterium]
MAPSVGALTPTSGSTTGGETVKIVGSNLDGATGVSFGGKPATFTVDSPNQITATAPAVPASTVDVRVIGPGGTSAINDGDKYTFTAAGSTAPGAGGPSLISTLTVAAKQTLSALAQSASKWRRGHQQAKISRAPIGTTFSFNLSKAATVKLAFTQKAAGRKVRGVCKAPNQSNSSKRKCTRTILAGSLSLPGHAGLNKLRFQGLLPNGKSLKLGSYNVSLTARDSAGLQSAAQSLSFLDRRLSVMRRLARRAAEPTMRREAIFTPVLAVSFSRWRRNQRLRMREPIHMLECAGCCGRSRASLRCWS